MRHGDSGASDPLGRPACSGWREPPARLADRNGRLEPQAGPAGGSARHSPDRRATRGPHGRSNRTTRSTSVSGSRITPTTKRSVM